VVHFAFVLFEDRAWFKQHVHGGVLVLGRRSFEETNQAIPGVNHTIVVSRKIYHEGSESEGVEFVPSFAHAIERAKQCVAASSLLLPSSSLPHHDFGCSHAMIWIGGGREIYASALPLASHLVLTQASKQQPVNFFCSSCFSHFSGRRMG
jgi:dihydrofolate reductase